MDLNNTILDHLQGEKTTLYSADKVVTERGADLVDDAIPVEYLNTLEATGLPPGNLHLKIGCPLILLQSLTPSCGLCNGTQMILLQVSRWVLQVCIMGRDYDGNVKLIPQISLTPTSTCTEFAFSLQWCQFPMQLAFAISINKAQGQSVKYVSLDLPSSATDSCISLSPMQQVVVMSKSSFWPEPLLCIWWMLYTQRSSNLMILKLCNHLQQLDYAHVCLYSTISRNWTWLCESNCHQHIYSSQC